MKNENETIQAQENEQEQQSPELKRELMVCSKCGYKSLEGIYSRTGEGVKSFKDFYICGSNCKKEVEKNEGLRRGYCLKCYRDITGLSK